MKRGRELTQHEKILRIIGVIISIIITLWFWHNLSERAHSRLIKSITRLIPTVGIATFIGTVVELRNWLRFMKLVITPLVSFARLPFLAGASMVTSLFSNKAAAGMLSGAYGENRISRAALLTTGICNSHFAYLSHSIRVLYPVAAAAGMTGLIYFAIQFGLGFGILFAALLIHRFSAKEMRGDDKSDNSVERALPSWEKTVKRALKRTVRIIIRLLLVTVPMYLLVLYLGQEGVFETWNALLPAQAAKVVTAEMMTVAISMMGGLVNASSLAAEMMRNGEITNVQILFAMLLGSALGNPVRTIRRNLPSAMGIYPPKEGFLIVFIMQSARFVTVIAVCAIIMFFLM